MQKIVECVPNFSEGRNLKVIKQITLAAKKIKGVKVLDTEWDRSHNRSLVTIIGTPTAVFDAAFAMIRKATSLIDMEKHTGEHPRIGATDVVPFIPVSGISIEECVTLAKKLGKKVGKELKIPVYLYEAAATSTARLNLADIRKGQYEGLKKEILTNLDKKPDFGPSKLHPTAGAVVIGARKFLIAYNVNLETSDINIAKQIANKIREKNGGFPGVKAMGFTVNGNAQISMNLVDFEKTNIDIVYQAIEKHAVEFGTKIKNSEIYGMVPLDALAKIVKDNFKADGFTSEQVLEKKMYE